MRCGGLLQRLPEVLLVGVIRSNEVCKDGYDNQQQDDCRSKDHNLSTKEDSDKPPQPTRSWLGLGLIIDTVTVVISTAR